MIREHGYPYVIVLGNPEYYPHFGSMPVSKHQIQYQWDGVPDKAFMVLIFDGNLMPEVAGIVRYRQEFN